MTQNATFKTLTACVALAAISFIAVFLLTEAPNWLSSRRQDPNESRLKGVRGPAIASASKSSKMRARKSARLERKAAIPVPVPVQDAEEEGPMLALAEQRQRPKNSRAITILQIGDSHTAADFFTGALRRILQERYGDGGPGYVIAGRPHLGVRSDVLKVSDNSGWSYEALQKSNDRSGFTLAGFNAVADAEGRSMTFRSEKPLASDVWEVEVFRQPGGGSIDIRVDGQVRRTVDLDAPKVEPVVIQVDAKKNTQALTVTTTGDGPVLLASVAAYNRSAGLTYNSVGFPGATIDIVNKFDEKILAAELKRIAPHIVVLAFGSNEGFNDNLDLDRYAASYREAVLKIQSALPRAAIVVVAPPDGARPGGTPGACAWQTPAKLNSVRNIQRDLAQHLGLAYWDWAAIMPAECGAHQWALMSPPLMAKDHLHLSRDGYKLSAEEFSKALIPIIEKIRVSVDVVSNY